MKARCRSKLKTRRRAWLEALESRQLLSVDTIFNPSDTAPEFQPDTVDVELGMKFESSEAGFVEGVRFYKGPDNIGTHIGHLWDANGTLLGTVTFTNETASGWQEADFANPIPIVANHVYIISYFAPVGRYSYTYNYFTGNSATSADGVLTGLASGTDGPNDVYAYGPPGIFPNQSFMDLNYWVDVVFSTTPDHPPTNISLSNNQVQEHQAPGTVVGTLGTTDPDAGDTFTYTLEDGPGGTGNAAFDIEGNQLVTTEPLDFATQSSYSIRVRSTDANGLSTAQIFTVNVVQQNEVLGEYLFYKGSAAFDQSGDDGAIATDKTALLPGGTASFSNYSSYDLGINGIMIDMQADVSTLVPSDFSFLVGNDNNPSDWTAVGAAPTITIRPGAGAGGSTRVELTWPDHTIQNEWLQVTMLADADTELSSDDVFYFGNAIGETGDSATDADVTAVDEIAARANAGPAGITSPYDFNRDGVVDATDEAIARANLTDFTNALQLITVPAGGMSLAPAGLAGGAAEAGSAAVGGIALTPVMSGNAITGPLDGENQTALLGSADVPAPLLEPRMGLQRNNAPAIRAKRAAEDARRTAEMHVKLTGRERRHERGGIDAGIGTGLE